MIVTVSLLHCIKFTVDYIILSVVSSNSSPFCVMDAIFLLGTRYRTPARACTYVRACVFVWVRACVCVRSCMFQTRKISYMFSVYDYNLFCNWDASEFWNIIKSTLHAMIINIIQIQININNKKRNCEIIKLPRILPFLLMCIALITQLRSYNSKK